VKPSAQSFCAALPALGLRLGVRIDPSLVLRNLISRTVRRCVEPAGVALSARAKQAQIYKKTHSLLNGRFRCISPFLLASAEVGN